MITADQCRMARAALNLTTRDLAGLAGIGVNTISRFEQGGETLVGTVNKIQRALESAGVLFIAENGDGPGVRLRKG